MVLPLQVAFQCEVFQGYGMTENAAAGKPSVHSGDML